MINNIIKNLDWSMLINPLLMVIPALLCITIHELSHGYIAYRLGDNTAKDMGRLTLNPIKHIDIFGLLMMVIFGFGWAKPVPVDMRNFKRPKTGMALTAIAGPLSNLILAVIVMFIFGLVLTPLAGAGNEDTVGSIALQIIQRTAYISVALAIFNLLPIPPLDGSKIVFSFLSDKIYYQVLRFERYGFIVLILFVNTALFSNTVGAATAALYNGFVEVTRVAYSLVN